jgi:glycosyltransferase involved in cell wall biosynthesis
VQVLHVYKNALPESIGGVEQVIDQIARGTSNLGVQNIVLSLSNSPCLHPIPLHGYELFTAKRNFEIASNGFSWQSLKLFKELSNQVDLVHYHFPWPFGDLINELYPPKTPIVLTYHSDIIRQKLLLHLYRPLKFKFLNSVNHIVATSPNYLQSSDTLKKFINKVSVIPIGLDFETYRNPDKKLVKYFREHFGEKFFLFIGAFRYYKGLDILIESARQINYPIVIAGSGPTEFFLKSKAQKYKLKNIFFVGNVSEANKVALLDACFGVVFPSNLRTEAFGVSLLEGAMFSKPLICCEIGTGTTFVNIHQETGLIIPPSDPHALARAMNWLWCNPNEATRMGQKARTRYEELFTAEQMAKSYFELYQKMLNH